MELLRTRLCDWRPVAIDALALAPPEVPEPRLAVGRANGAVELWDTTSWHLQRSAPGCDRRSVRGFVWTAAGDEGSTWRLLSAGLHTEITEWDLATLEPTVSVSSGGGAVWAICALGERLYAACDDGSVRIFSLEGGAGEILYARRFVVGKERLLSVALVGTDSLFAGSSNSLITKWSISTGTCEAKMSLEKAKGGETLCWVLAGLSERELASGDSLGIVQIWDAVTCTVLHRFMQHQADVLTLAASPEGVLLSAGIDAKICHFFRQPDAEERWIVGDGDWYHTHDVRALALVDNGVRGRYVSGGVTGNLSIHRLGQASHRPSECSSLSPIFQTASTAQDSRVVLCQRDAHLELWYLQQPKELSTPSSDAAEAAGDGVPVRFPGRVPVSVGRLPEAQLVLRVSLGTSAEGQHVTASAITPDGRHFAASDVSGTRLFHLNVDDLEVRSEKGLPEEVRKMAASALLFCGAGLLAVAASGSREVVVVDISRLAVVARFTKHHARPVSHLAAAGEWLASADVGGPGGGAEAAAHVFSLDKLQHQARVPVGAGRGFPTAIGFDAQGKRLVVVLSSHEVIVWDVEAQALVRTLQRFASSVPPKLVPPHARICGVAAPPGHANKVLIWGHSHLLTLDLGPPSEAAVSSSVDSDGHHPAKKRKGSLKNNRQHADDPDIKGPWRSYRGMQHILGLCALDEARWGSPVLKGYYLEPEPGAAASATAGTATVGRKSAKRRAAGAANGGPMILSLEVSKEAILKSLPQAFERRRFVKDPSEKASSQ